MNYVPNQNGKVLEETLAGSNSDVVKTTLRHLRSLKVTLFFNDSLLCNFFKNLSPFLCHFFTENREYNKWLCMLKHHIQVSRLPVQGPWLDLRYLDRWWRCSLPSGPSLTLPHRNSCIETHFVLLAKIIEYTVFQSPHCFVLIEAV